MKIDGSGQRKTQRGVCSRAHGKWAGPIGYKLSSGEGGLLTGLWHSSPAHRYLSAIPAWRRGSSDRSSARQPCPQVLQSHPRVAKGRKSVPLTGLRSGLGPGLARGPCAQVLQRHPGVAKQSSIGSSSIKCRYSMDIEVRIEFLSIKCRCFMDVALTRPPGFSGDYFIPRISIPTS